MRRRRGFLLLLSAMSGMGMVACGASINAVYEGDVRFEHCMALDEHEDEKSSIQRACWDEWVRYYTYGQTRDRVDYARKRTRELSGESDFTEEPIQSALAQRAVPEPTTVLAPPPMMITDAGKPPEPDAAPADAAPPEPPATACASQCRDTWTPCKTACTNAACENKCAATYKKCMKKCF